MMRLSILATLACLGGPCLAGEPAGIVDAALENVTSIVRPGRIGYATVWDGNKYVQCRRTTTHEFRCEAAGSAMQPSLASVLKPERLAVLAGLGWMLDPSFGNHVRTFPADMSTAIVAQSVLSILVRAYDADPASLDVKTDWVVDIPCPPRNGPRQNLAGSVNDAPAMRAVAIRTCAFAPDPPVIRAETLEDLVAQYGGLVKAELQRLRVNVGRSVFAVFDGGIGYVQCQPKPPRSLYCEASSVESWPALAAILTPERVDRLRDAGYAPPGRAQNHWRDYDLDAISDAELAVEILKILHDVYGYQGATRLNVTTK